MGIAILPGEERIRHMGRWMRGIPLSGGSRAQSETVGPMYSQRATASLEQQGLTRDESTERKDSRQFRQRKYLLEQGARNMFPGVTQKLKPGFFTRPVGVNVCLLSKYARPPSLSEKRDTKQAGGRPRAARVAQPARHTGK
jgi:hypothetical protein